MQNWCNVCKIKCGTFFNQTKHHLTMKNLNRSSGGIAGSIQRNIWGRSFRNFFRHVTANAHSGLTVDRVLSVSAKWIQAIFEIYLNICKLSLKTNTTAFKSMGKNWNYDINSKLVSTELINQFVLWSALSVGWFLCRVC